MLAGGGTCFPVALNIWPMCPAGVQFAIAILPPGTANAHEFTCNQFWSWREHGSEHTHHYIKGGSVIRKTFSVALVKLDRQVFGCGSSAALFE